MRVALCRLVILDSSSFLLTRALSFAGLGAMSSFSTTRANEAFETAFTRPVKALLQREIADSGRAYAEIGSLWVQAEQALSRLPENERHVPAADATLKSDVQDAVAHRFVALVDELKPQVQRAPDAGGPFTLQKRVSSLNAGYEQAQLAAAANRAAVESFQGLPIKHAMSPGAVTDAAVGAGDVEEGGPELDIIDALAGRIRAGVASGEFGDDKNEKPPGNGTAAEAGRAAAVPPALARAAERLVSVGCPPLRVEKRYGATLALHLLQTKDTFTSWAESRGLSGAPLREVLTIARALDLATHNSGAKYLMSDPAEVQLRRLYSVCLAAKLGSYKLSQQLEELPGEGALAELPASIFREMSEALKLELKIEQLVKG